MREPTDNVRIASQLHAIGFFYHATPLAELALLTRLRGRAVVSMAQLQRTVTCPEKRRSCACMVRTGGMHIAFGLLQQALDTLHTNKDTGVHIRCRNRSTYSLGTWRAYLGHTWRASCLSGCTPHPKQLQGAHGTSRPLSPHLSQRRAGF